mgnify:CR=1 FL=1
MHLKMRDVSCLKPGQEGVLVVLRFSLAVEYIAIQLDLLVAKLARRHGRQLAQLAQAARCLAQPVPRAVIFLLVMPLNAALPLPWH